MEVSRYSFSDYITIFNFISKVIYSYNNYKDVDGSLTSPLRREKTTEYALRDKNVDNYILEMQSKSKPIKITASYTILLSDKVSTFNIVIIEAINDDNIKSECEFCSPLFKGDPIHLYLFIDSRFINNDNSLETSSKAYYLAQILNQILSVNNYSYILTQYQMKEINKLLSQLIFNDGEKDDYFASRREITNKYINRILNNYTVSSYSDYLCLNNNNELRETINDYINDL